MRADAQLIVDRMIGSNHEPFLALVDDARLADPVVPDQACLDSLEPYRWLMRQVGDGIRLTQAGYLPPKLVAQAVDELGWADDIHGKANREENVFPVRLLRETAQHFRLVRKYRGDLLPTPRGRALASDAEALWWHVASRLPLGRDDVEQDAGLVYLLMTAAGRPRDEKLVADALVMLGWRPRDGSSVKAPDAWTLFGDTWRWFLHMRLLSNDLRAMRLEEPPLNTAVTIARAALIGNATEAVLASAHADMPSKSQSAVQILVTLRDTNPPVWRRIVVPSKTTLLVLSNVILAAMGWQGYHLHLFEIDGVMYGDVDDFGVPTGEERTTTIADVVARTGCSATSTTSATAGITMC